MATKPPAMNKVLFSSIILLLLIVAGCSKNSSSTDNTIGWPGTYSNANTQKQLNRVVISRVDNNTLQVQLQIDSAAYIVTVATFNKATAINSSTMAVNENTGIIGITDSTFQFVATGALNGNNLILSGSATNIAAPADVKNFYFNGNK